MRLDVPLTAGKLKLQISSDIALVPGLGAHQSRIPLTVEGEGLAENSLVSLRGTLWLNGAGPSYLTAWTTEKQVGLRTFPIQHKMVASLSDDQLAAIERHRNGKQLGLIIDVKASISGIPDAWPTGTVQGTLRIPASQWLSALESVGAAASLTIVVPAPLAGGDRQQMGVRLREARAAIDDGRYEDAVSSARKALEAARKRETLHGEVATRAKNPKTLSQEERWSVLHHAIWGLACLAPHEDPVTQGATWSRADAVAIVATTAALIARHD
jgi:hypothetical protein